VPYEATTSYGKGTKNGPRAIIEASSQVELFDDEFADEPYDVGVATLDPLELSGVGPANLSSHVSPQVKKILSDGKWPMILGGEHSITPAVMPAFKHSGADLTVVQFDAHADLRDEYLGEPMSHACAMARTLEFYPTVQIGIRNFSSQGFAYSKKAETKIISANTVKFDSEWMDEMISSIKTNDIYITFDVDVFDASIIPATGTPEPGGLDWSNVIDGLRRLFFKKNVLGIDIVELSPIKGFHSYDFTIAKLAYKCIAFKKHLSY